MIITTTGGRGFIGSHFIELCLAKGHTIIDIDFMGYCANKNLPFDNHSKYNHINEDICNIKHIPSCDILVNFAAETHVGLTVLLTLIV